MYCLRVQNRYTANSFKGLHKNGRLRKWAKCLLQADLGHIKTTHGEKNCQHATKPNITFFYLMYSTFWRSWFVMLYFTKIRLSRYFEHKLAIRSLSLTSISDVLQTQTVLVAIALGFHKNIVNT